MSLTPSAQMRELICAAAEGKQLKKAVFSKSTDPAIVRAVATLRHVGKSDCLQIECFCTDNKAKHENIPLCDLSASPRIAELIAAFQQINLITTAGDAELRTSKKGKTALIGGDRLEKALGSSDTTVEVDKFAAEWIFGKEKMDVREKVVMPETTILR